MPEPGQKTAGAQHRGSPSRTLHETLPSLRKDRHRAWPPALDGLWEAAWVGGPGIGESSGARMFLLVRASKLWPGLAPSGSSGAGGTQAQVGRVTHDCTVGLYVS